MTLVEFLLARLDEDEAVARAANGPRWAPGDGSVSEGGLYAYSPGTTDDRDGWAIAWFEHGETNPEQRIGGQNWERHTHENAVHAARHNPSRVLAEVEAKRRIVEAALAVVDPDPGEDVYADTDYLDDGQVWAFGTTLRALALPYADHPDYDEAWRP